jgi:hypothetical protein
MESFLASGLGLSIAWGYLAAILGKDEWLIPISIATLLLFVALAFQQEVIVCAVS